MVAGCTPFKGSNALEIISEILKTEPAPLARHIAEASPRLQAIVGKALHKDRAERYQRIEDLLFDLKPLRQELASDKEPNASLSQ